MLFWCNVGYVPDQVYSGIQNKEAHVLHDQPTRSLLLVSGRHTSQSLSRYIPTRDRSLRYACKLTISLKISGIEVRLCNLSGIEEWLITNCQFTKLWLERYEKIERPSLWWLIYCVQKQKERGWAIWGIVRTCVE